MKNYFLFYSKPQRALLITVVLITAVNLVFLLKQIVPYIQAMNQPALSARPGEEFIEFRPYLAGITTIGFLTNKSITAEKNDGQFLKAQYILSPVVLDLQNSGYRFLLLDCTNLVIAFDTMQKINAVPILVNRYGKVLAERKQ